MNVDTGREMATRRRMPTRLHCLRKGAIVEGRMSVSSSTAERRIAWPEMQVQGLPGAVAQEGRPGSALATTMDRSPADRECSAWKADALPTELHPQGRRRASSPSAEHHSRGPHSGGGAVVATSRLAPAASFATLAAGYNGGNHRPTPCAPGGPGGRRRIGRTTDGARARSPLPRLGILRMVAAPGLPQQPVAQLRAEHAPTVAPVWGHASPGPRAGSAARRRPTAHRDGATLLRDHPGADPDHPSLLAVGGGSRSRPSIDGDGSRGDGACPSAGGALAAPGEAGEPGARRRDAGLAGGPSWSANGDSVKPAVHDDQAPAPHGHAPGRNLRDAGGVRDGRVAPVSPWREPADQLRDMHVLPPLAQERVAGSGACDPAWAAGVGPAGSMAAPRSALAHEPRPGLERPALRAGPPPGVRCGAAAQVVAKPAPSPGRGPGRPARGRGDGDGGARASRRADDGGVSAPARDAGGGVPGQVRLSAEAAP